VCQAIFLCSRPASVIASEAKQSLSTVIPASAYGEISPIRRIGGKAGIQNKNDISALGSQITREIVIPELTKEVNEDKNFVKLRQVYNSLILATWYKKKIKDSILEQVYVDKNKTAGVQYTSTVIPAKAGIHFENDVEGLYQEYLKAFKKGVYNFIKEEYDPAIQVTIPRKYFSGGVTFLYDKAQYVDEKTASPAILNQITGIQHTDLAQVSANLSALGQKTDNSTQIHRDAAMITPVKIEMSPEALKIVPSKYLSRIVEVAGAQKTPEDILVSGRSRTIVLDKPFSMNGRTIRFLRLKGVTYQGGPPQMEVYQSNPGEVNVRQAQVTMADQNGRIVFLPYGPNPRGTKYLESVRKEYVNAEAVSHAGISTSLPIGIGKFVGKQFQGKEVGFTIFAEEYDPSPRLWTVFLKRKRALDEELKGQSADIRAKAYGDLLSDFGKAIKGAVQLLRQLNNAGYVHNAAHLDQFNYDSQNHSATAIYDLADIHTTDISRDEFTARFIARFLDFFGSVDMVRHLIPSDVWLRLEQKRKNIYEEFLDGYFTPLEKTSMVEPYGGDMGAEIFLQTYAGAGLEQMYHPEDGGLGGMTWKEAARMFMLGGINPLTKEIKVIAQEIYDQKQNAAVPALAEKNKQAVETKIREIARKYESKGVKYDDISRLAGKYINTKKLWRLFQEDPFKSWSEYFRERPGLNGVVLSPVVYIYSSIIEEGLILDKREVLKSELKLHYDFLFPDRMTDEIIKKYIETPTFEVIDPQDINWSRLERELKKGLKKDGAQLAKGGIDFNSNRINLQVKMDSRFRGNDSREGGNDSGGVGNSKGIQFKIDPAMLQQLQNAPGFTVGSITIQPLKSLPAFLGISKKTGNSDGVG